MRINGDGTIRLRLYNSINSELNARKFNAEHSSRKYVGYTYDNEKTCTKSNPCTKDTGTSSTIKKELETWYNNLSAYDEYIVLETFFNDTSEDNTTNGTTYYEARYRSTSPSLKCSNTINNYGGYYQLKIKLMTMDEYIF